MTTLWNGVAVALATLFDEDLSVAVGATADHAARMTAAGVRAVVVAGSTGEAAALTTAERAALVGAVKVACPGVPVVVGASADWWRPAVDRVSALVVAGADALLVAPPRTGGVYPFFDRVVAAAAGVPVLAYHYPPVAGGAVPVEALADLGVAGVKDSSGEPERLLRQVAGFDGATYTGSVHLTGFAARVGAAGAILAAANLAPEDCVAAWSGRAGAQVALLAAHDAVRREFPWGLKAALAQRYGTSSACRLG